MEALRDNDRSANTCKLRFNCWIWPIQQLTTECASKKFSLELFEVLDTAYNITLLK